MKKVELKRLVGSSEYFDFISNRANNVANFDRITRENVLGSVIDYLYINNKIPVPGMDDILEVDNKKINIIVGNRTNSFNICGGELSGSCMRIGGIGEGLFLFALMNNNWFHIRFEDPITHEYISRVTGFRNGNTLFLNQLRDSNRATILSW